MKLNIYWESEKVCGKSQVVVKEKEFKSWKCLISVRLYFQKVEVVYPLTNKNSKNKNKLIMKYFKFLSVELYNSIYDFTSTI